MQSNDQVPFKNRSNKKLEITWKTPPPPINVPNPKIEQAQQAQQTLFTLNSVSTQTENKS